VYKKRIVQIFVLLFIVFSSFRAFAADSNQDYSRTYKLYMDLGKKAIDYKEYENAYEFFKYASIVEPESQEPIQYLNIIKRLLEGNVEADRKPVSKEATSNEQEGTIEDQLGDFSRTKKAAVSEALDAIEYEFYDDTKENDKLRQGISNGEGEISVEKELPDGKRIVELPDEVKKKKKAVVEKTNGIFGFAEPLYLNEEVENSQPNTTIRLELNQSIIIEGESIKRLLAITPGFIEAEIVGQDRIKVSAIRIGSTYLHIWDQNKRWTFNIEVIFPIRKDSIRSKEDQEEEKGDPFKFAYSADWISYYDGNSIRSLERNHLNYIQWAGIYGDTPYGKMDTSATFNMFDESTEVTGYGVGLTNGKIGNFKDFTIRGFDTSKEFSELTLPGKSFRGFILDSYAFDHRVAYSYMHGRDRSTFSRVSAGILEKQESFLEGFKATLFPDQENNVSFNFARGYGTARSEQLKDRVFSVQGQRRIKDVMVNTELAYDEMNIASLYNVNYTKDKFSLNAKLRNIDKDFTTITGYAGGRGEIGGTLSTRIQLDNSSVASYLDLYEDRYLSNPNKPDALNFDFNTSVDTSLSKTDRIINSIYYVNTRGEIFPREDLRLVSNYTKQIPVWSGRQLTASLRGGYQRSRHEFSTSSEYDSLYLSSGLSLMLFKGFRYYMNYQYNIVKEKSTGEMDAPTVFNAGLNYSRLLFNSISGQASLSYRNEEKTEGNNSFLAGTDSLVGSLGLTYSPSDDVELFVDGSLSNTWAENNNNSAFNDASIRVGVRTSWDSPFFWNPKGIVTGLVYKDINGNQQQDSDEAGIAGVGVKVGKQTVFTNTAGFYETKIRAQKVLVGIDINTIPEGFVFSTKAFEKVEIIPRKRQKVDFGLTAQSGIYGVVYCDKNGNSKPDEGDEFVARAKIILDDDNEIYSDHEGTFFFRNILPGKHDIHIDMNSLPIKYLPTIQLKKNIDLSEGTTYVFHVPLKKTGKKEE